MSTRNIALDSKVYQRLAAFKGQSESFSRAVARMLDTLQSANTGRDLRSRLAGLPALSPEDAEAMLRLRDEARREERWESHDLG
jgi:predicted CopG family antitoxin